MEQIHFLVQRSTAGPDVDFLSSKYSEGFLSRVALSNGGHMSDTRYVDTLRIVTY